MVLYLYLWYIWRQIYLYRSTGRAVVMCPQAVFINNTKHAGLELFVSGYRAFSPHLQISLSLRTLNIHVFL
jgi:hypothetical protein